MKLLYTKTDDPNEPCGYCVGWRNVDTDDPMSDTHPIEADGARIYVLYGGIHPECQAMVDAYIEDHKDDLA